MDERPSGVCAKSIEFLTSSSSIKLSNSEDLLSHEKLNKIIIAKNEKYKFFIAFNGLMYLQDSKLFRVCQVSHN